MNIATAEERRQLALAAAAVGGFDSPIRGSEFKAAMPGVAVRIVNHGCRVIAPNTTVNAHVKVTFAGNTAFCNHRNWALGCAATINLPALADTRILSRAEANRWVGYLIHECFHAVMTSRPTWDNFVRLNSPFRARLLNAVEDARIERDGVALGVAHGFAKVGSLLLAHLMAEGEGKYQPNDPRQMPWVFAVGLRHYAVPGTDRLIAALRPEIRDVLVWARSEFNWLPSAQGDVGRTGTQHAGDLANKIADRLKAIFGEPQVEPPINPGEPGDDGEEGEPGEKGRGKGKPLPKDDDESDDPKDDDEGEGEDSESDDDDEGEGGKSGPESDDEGDEGEEGEGSESDDGDDDDGEGEGSDGDDGDGEEGGPGDDEGEGEGDGGADDSPQPDGDESGNGADVSHVKDRRPTPANEPVDVDALTSAEIPSPEPTLHEDRDNTSENVPNLFDPPSDINVDGFDWVDPQKNARAADRVLRSVRGLVGARGALRRLLQRTDSSGELRGMKGGRLVPSRMHRAALNDETIFSRRWEEEGVDVAVSIVIDTSGSMKRNCIQPAATTALIIAEQLVTTPGCKVEVLGFTEEGQRNIGYDDPYAWERAGVRSQDAWCHRGCNFRVYKQFREHIGFMRRRWAQMLYASGGTPDLAALNGVAARLARQPAGRRICFFICDGDGSGDAQFRGAVDRLSRQHGILFIGLGIGCDHNFPGRFQFGGIVWDVNKLAEDALNLIVRAVEKSGKA